MPGWATEGDKLQYCCFRVEVLCQKGLVATMYSGTGLKIGQLVSIVSQRDTAVGIAYKDSVLIHDTTNFAFEFASYLAEPKEAIDTEYGRIFRYHQGIQHPYHGYSSIPFQACYQVRGEDCLRPSSAVSVQDELRQAFTDSIFERAER